jgi:hypothetical protein
MMGDDGRGMDTWMEGVGLIVGHANVHNTQVTGALDLETDKQVAGSINGEWFILRGV